MGELFLDLGLLKELLVAVMDVEGPLPIVTMAIALVFLACVVLFRNSSDVIRVPVFIVFAILAVLVPFAMSAGILHRQLEVVDEGFRKCYEVTNLLEENGEGFLAVRRPNSPNSSEVILARRHNNDKLFGYAQDGDWLNVQFIVENPKVHGWVHRKYTKEVDC